MKRLQTKVALVTGAARGIGAATAQRFAEEGATVVLTDIDDALGEKTARLVPGASYRRLDVRSEADWAAAIRCTLEAHQHLDIVVNNAGITGFDPPVGPQDPEHASLESWRAVLATNLDGVFLGCRFAIAAMRPPEGRGGSIVNISSRSGQVGIPSAAAYAASKAGVRNHSKTVALYCAEHGYGIRCNSVHPGAILTPMWEPLLGEGVAREAAMAAFTADVPLRRFGTAADVAALIAYLASDESGYVTGAEFAIDGGILAGATAQPRSDG